MSGATLILIIWVLAKVPDYPGQTASKRHSISKVFVMPGVRPVLFVMLTFVFAHNILYTYIAPFLAISDMAERTDLVLLIFGVASLIGIWVVGVLIDRHLRALTLASTALFGLAVAVLGILGDSPIAVCGAVGVWGLAFGGAATFFSDRACQDNGRRHRCRAIHARHRLEHSNCGRRPHRRSVVRKDWRQCFRPSHALPACASARCGLDSAPPRLSA